MIVFKTEIDSIARSLDPNAQVGRTGLEAAVMSGHWTNEEKQFLLWASRSNFRFHLYDFRRAEVPPPPSVPAAVAAIHATAQEVAPLTKVEAFLGPAEQVDWGSDGGEWRREFLAERRRVSGILRVVDDFTGKVAPLKVFDIESDRVRAALSDLETGRGTGGERFFALQEATYDKHLKGTSVTKYRWFCIAKGIAQGKPVFLDLGTAPRNIHASTT
jgi:hypothetical protein